MKSEKATPKWKELLDISFLTDEMKEKYLELFEARIAMFM
jgi:serine/threonine-protein kinase HipA